MQQTEPEQPDIEWLVLRNWQKITQNLPAKDKAELVTKTGMSEGFCSGYLEQLRELYGSEILSSDYNKNPFKKIALTESGHQFRD